MTEKGQPEGNTPGEKQFIRETIQKPPRQERKLGRFIGFVIAMGLLFGVVASLAFTVSGGWFRRILPSGEPPLESVDILLDETTPAAGTETTAVGPEDSETESPEEEETEESAEEPVTFPADETGAEEVRSCLQEVHDIAGKLKNSLVIVTSLSAQEDVFRQTYTHRQETPGVIIAMTGSDIRILTDSNLLENADSVQITLEDGTTGEAALLGRDRTTGIAVISLPKDALPAEELERLGTARLGNSYRMQMGDMVVAMGDPVGYLPSLAAGIISHVETRVEGTDFILQKLHTDISCVPESGGFLVNSDAEIVGWITPEHSAEEGAEYLAAYSISDLKIIIERLSNGGAISRLGVHLQAVTSTLAEQRSMPRGLYVTEVIEDTPALRAGIRNGDILVGIDSHALQTGSDLQSFLLQADPGEEISVTVMRKGRDGYAEQEFKVTLDER